MTASAADEWMSFPDAAKALGLDAKPFRHLRHRRGWKTAQDPANGRLYLVRRADVEAELKNRPGPKQASASSRAGAMRRHFEGTGIVARVDLLSDYYGRYGLPRRTPTLEE